eukprot:3829293-Pleurochrysis_carterae.AAC.1
MDCGACLAAALHLAVASQCLTNDRIKRLRPLPPVYSLIRICCSTQVYITTLSGQLIKALSSGKREGGDFVQCCVSAQ